jgi:hypothetical protein
MRGAYGRGPCGRAPVGGRLARAPTETQGAPLLLRRGFGEVFQIHETSLEAFAHHLVHVHHEARGFRDEIVFHRHGPGDFGAGARRTEDEVRRVGAIQGLKNSNLKRTSSLGRLSVIVMRPAPTLALPAHSSEEPTPAAGPANVYVAAGSFLT